MKKAISVAAALSSLLLCAGALPVWAEDGSSRRVIEEVIVTAERQEASVSDTSISITALTSDFLEDFGVRNQSDLQNLIPSTTIQPYDSAIRGVGRNFRNLGGDPGVATYINGVYSEDLYTATIGSLWDIERVEVLRGPQGTLYGRNAVGGAINFLYKKPEAEFDFGVKALGGDFGQQEVYGFVTGPLIKDKLNGRFSTSSRRHDGWIEERGQLGGPDLDSGDERNFSVQLDWTISDKASLSLRSNRAIVDRVVGGADGGGLIVLSGENFNTDGSRNFDRLSNGLRGVNPGQLDPAQSDFVDPNQSVLEFTNPTTGETILGQFVRPGIDSSGNGGVFNHGAGGIPEGRDPFECVFVDRNNIDGDDLCAFTNGQNSEIFNQQGNQLEFDYAFSDQVSLKYIFGFNQFLYERTTDDDNTDSTEFDRQFFVTQEADYLSHELQLFWDLSPELSFTSGIFFYDATIDQRADFFSVGEQDQFNDPNFALAVGGPVAGANLSSLVFQPGAEAAGFAGGLNVDSARQFAAATGAPVGSFNLVTAPFLGNSSLGNVERVFGATNGTDLLYDTTTIRDSFAAYTQGVYDVNEKISLTFGLRYAKDDLKGQESTVSATQSAAAAAAFGGLSVVNALRGAIDPATGELTGFVDPLLDGVPLSLSLFRELERSDTDLTWRVNVDYSLTDSSLLYANITTGYRGGGFNLVFFSQNPEFEPEELIAYEIGYKGRFADGTLQLNGSAYLYDYDSIHTFTEEACDVTDPNPQSLCVLVDTTASVQAAPGAEVIGAELEWLWLATDRLTIGGNASYTRAEFDQDFFVVDGFDPTSPAALFTADTQADRVLNVNGNRLPQVPETKASAFFDYQVPLAQSGNLAFRLSYSYISDVVFSAFEQDRDTAPSYDRWDFRSSWTSANEQWQVSAFVNNVLDEVGIRQILRGGTADGFIRTAQVTEPRHAGLEFSFNFK